LRHTRKEYVTTGFFVVRTVCSQWCAVCNTHFRRDDIRLDKKNPKAFAFGFLSMGYEKDIFAVLHMNSNSYITVRF